jgi:hypothetical protein
MGDAQDALLRHADSSSELIVVNSLSKSLS